MPPLLADFIHPRVCKPICEKSLTLPVCKLRNRILADTGIDFFQYATALSETWITYANSLIK